MLSVFAAPFYLISAVFSVLHDKNFETNENISNRIDESNTPFFNTIHEMVWWVGWIDFLFSSLFLEKTVLDLLAFCWLQSDGLVELISFFLVIFRENCIWPPCCLLVTAWLSLDTSGETTSSITFFCSLVC